MNMINASDLLWASSHCMRLHTWKKCSFEKPSHYAFMSAVEGWVGVLVNAATRHAGDFKNNMFLPHSCVAIQPWGGGGGGSVTET